MYSSEHNVKSRNEHGGVGKLSCNFGAFLFMWVWKISWLLCAHLKHREDISPTLGEFASVTIESTYKVFDIDPVAQ